MAAILCDGIGGICTGTCKLIVLPCKLCGMGCNKISSFLCCAPISLSNLICRNPLSLYIGTVLVAQTPPIIFGLLSMFDLLNNVISYSDTDHEVEMIGGCHSGSYWLLVGILFSIINIATAFYLGIRIANADDLAVQHLQSSYKRVCHFLCRDPWIAFYILILIAYLIWLFLGMNRGLVLGDYKYYILFCDKYAGHTQYYDDIHSRIIDVIGFSWFFLIGGSFAFAFSLCCTCCDHRNYSSSNAHETPTTTPPNNTTANNNNNNNNNNDNRRPDVETPRPSSPYAHHEQQQPSTYIYSSQGIPIHTGLQHDIPVARAEAIPLPTTKTTATKSAAAQGYFTAAAAAIPAHPKSTAPPSGFDSTSNDKNVEKEYEVAAAAFEATVDEDKKPSAVANAGSAVGKGLGTLLFNSNKSRQQQFEKQGENAGKAVGRGLSMAKQFVSSKLNKDNDKK